jgi:hypothetical protein
MLFPRSGWYASTRGFEKKGGDVCESEGIGILSTQYSQILSQQNTLPTVNRYECVGDRISHTICCS